MITKPTVLVLGAGASMPYGFPSGDDLKGLIIKNLMPPRSDWHDLFVELGFKRALMTQFYSELQRSSVLSIDTFLGHRKEFQSIGKAAIARCLIECEEEKRIIDSPNDPESSNPQQWYKYLISKMDADFRKFDHNELSVITFNYDRSFEQCLFNHLQTTYGKTPRQCIGKLNSIPIIHVHGQLGLLPWQGEPNRGYIAQPTEEAVKIASESITIVSENNYKFPAYTEAFKQLCKAKKIFFLGFGYHEENLGNLSIKIFEREGKEIAGTAYDIGRSIRNDITSRWGISLDQSNYDIYRFLTNVVLLQ